MAPSSLRIEDNRARIVATAELTLRGTYDSPLLFGNAEIERGVVFFEGNQYRVTRGSISYANPTKIEPFFDIEAETNVLVPGQVYRVVFRALGTTERLNFDFSSDPPLPEIDILSLLLGDVRDPQSGELRALRAPGRDRAAADSNRRRAAADESAVFGCGEGGRAVLWRRHVSDHAVARAIRLRSSRQSSTPRRCS